MASMLANFPDKKTKTFAIAIAVIGFLSWIASASAGVNAMDTFINAATASQATNAEDLEAIARAIWNFQVASLVSSLVVGAAFCGIAYWMYKLDKPTSTSTTAAATGTQKNYLTMACLVGAVLSIVLCVATSSALIDGTTDLGILSDTQDTGANGAGTVMTDATDEARKAPATVLCVGIAAAIAFVVGLVVLKKEGSTAETKTSTN